ncbi:MAG: methyltransferase domain-containing protein [Marmoricola sp.]
MGAFVEVAGGPDAGTGVIEFGPLRIGYDSTVLRPRPWTEVQGRWASELLAVLPPGPVLELCTGAGQIGLLAVHSHDRHLVAVDASEEACSWARRNARRNGMAAEVRHGDITTALGADERFALVVADPPWVPHGAVGRFPDDPLTAIDGGEDGLDIARTCVEVIGRHLVPGGAALLQVGSPEQVDQLAEAFGHASLEETERVVLLGRGVVVRLDPVSG